MRFLAFTDVHANLKAVERLIQKAKQFHVELLVCAGDFTIFGRAAEEVLEMLDTIGLPVLLIHGNHEDEDHITHILKKHKNIKWIHKDAHQYKNFVFIGYGGGGFARREPEFASFIKSHKQKKNVVLVTHQPPYKTILDDMGDGEFVGNVDFRKYIDECKPIMAISGHIHENAHKQDVLDSTFLINPGPLGKVLEIDDTDDNQSTDKKSTRKTR